MTVVKLLLFRFKIQCLCFVKFLVILLLVFKPTTNVAPRIAGRRIEGSHILDVGLGLTAMIVCEVTGFPVPIFRTKWQHSSSCQQREV
ncbi:hypothetical protein B566_EDAN011742 [Ephemera danica]|nr:hypothetical protein B566_EDAN011742 [Ephemera danica]